MSCRSLYIHVPFCERKCNYCAFESAVPREGERELWLSMLEREFSLRLSSAERPRLATCYVGGGTPTTLTGPQWLELTELIERYFDCDQKAEVTVEANPNSLRAEHLLTWRDWRVTRVSIGVQSFDDAELSLMGRLHSPRQAHGAISAALASGFSVRARILSSGCPIRASPTGGAPCARRRAAAWIIYRSTSCRLRRARRGDRSMKRSSATDTLPTGGPSGTFRARATRSMRSQTSRNRGARAATTSTTGARGNTSEPGRGPPAICRGFAIKTSANCGDTRRS